MVQRECPYFTTSQGQSDIVVAVQIAKLKSKITVKKRAPGLRAGRSGWAYFGDGEGMDCPRGEGSVALAFALPRVPPLARRDPGNRNSPYTGYLEAICVALAASSSRYWISSRAFFRVRRSRIWPGIR